MSAASKAARHRAEVLGLYKRILRAAQDYPSLKQRKIANEIRCEFRCNSKEEDATKIEKMLAEAKSGLKQLLHFVGERARLRATPSIPKWLPRDRETRRAWAEQGSGDATAGVEQSQRRGADKWALDELGIGASATMAEAKASYHERDKACHPDSGTQAASAEAFRRLQEAWEHVRMHLLQAQQGRRFR